MGLAASQARFLAITSRKAYCEFQSMEIAQDKLSVTRDLSKISQEYQNALNQTKLVWDYDGSGEELYNLSYGVLMTPTILNNFNPYLITTRTGSVVLNGQLASAAEKISPNGSPVKRSEEGFKTFVEALTGSGVLPPSTAEDIMAQKYDEDAGYGAEPLNKNGVVANNLVGLAYQAAQFNIGEVILGTITKDDSQSPIRITVNGKILTNDEIKELTLGDILTNNVTFRQQYQDGHHNYNDIDFQGKVDAILEFGTDALKQILGLDAVSESALNNAYHLTQDQYLTEPVTVGADKISDTASWNRAQENIGKNNIVWVKNDGKDGNSTAGVSLTNMFASYLTYFELIYNGYDSVYSVGSTEDTSNFVTDDPYYNYVMKGKDSVDNETIMKADFYMQLYNNICINGWTRNDSIEDDNYLENALKNGTYFITSLNDDGYFYQNRYNEEDCIVEVKDEDAIAQAEAEFTSKKTKLTYKEEKLDLEMKNLDTEISSLTTEYDSVKNLISKNVEKVFSMFQ